jgi:hypothetical protein
MDDAHHVVVPLGPPGVLDLAAETLGEPGPVRQAIDRVLGRLHTLGGQVDRQTYLGIPPPPLASRRPYPEPAVVAAAADLSQRPGPGVPAQTLRCGERPLRRRSSRVTRRPRKWATISDAISTRRCFTPRLRQPARRVGGSRPERARIAPAAVVALSSSWRRRMGPAGSPRTPPYPSLGRLPRRPRGRPDRSSVCGDPWQRAASPPRPFAASLLGGT